jgi:hypothetical protein
MQHFLTYALCLLALHFTSICHGDPGRIYTKPDPAATGGIQGQAGIELTHAIAIDQERVHVYLAELSEAGKSFNFAHIPIGKYDLVLVTKDGAVYEGLTLGDPADSITGTSLKNLQTRIAVADAFFNRSEVYRIGLDGERVLAFVERIRDKVTLKQSGDVLDANLRRLEIIELEQATDDWQMATTRHIYREELPRTDSPPFLKHIYFSGLGNIRVVDSLKDLGALTLPKN